MKMFRTKYFALSIIIHFALISLFITYKKISEKAETTMLVTEIIKIKEPSELTNEVYYCISSTKKIILTGKSINC